MGLDLCSLLGDLKLKKVGFRSDSYRKCYFTDRLLLWLEYNYLQKSHVYRTSIGKLSTDYLHSFLSEGQEIYVGNV